MSTATYQWQPSTAEIARRAGIPPEAVVRFDHNTSPSTRLTLEHFWELLTFLVNSMVFMVIGLTISLDTLTLFDSGTFHRSRPHPVGPASARGRKW